MHRFAPAVGLRHVEKNDLHPPKYWYWILIILPLSIDNSIEIWVRNIMTFMSIYCQSFQYFSILFNTLSQIIVYNTEIAAYNYISHCSQPKLGLWCCGAHLGSQGWLLTAIAGACDAMLLFNILSILFNIFQYIDSIYCSPVSAP